MSNSENEILTKKTCFSSLVHVANFWLVCFCNVCSAAVRHHSEYRKATDTAIDAVVREWPRTAGDRDRGHKYRYHRSQSQPASDGHHWTSPPSTRRTTLGDRAFPVTAVRTWNALPSSVRSAPSLLQFHRDLKTAQHVTVIILFTIVSSCVTDCNF